MLYKFPTKKVKCFEIGTFQEFQNAKVLSVYSCVHGVDVNHQTSCQLEKQSIPVVPALCACDPWGGCYTNFPHTRTRLIPILASEVTNWGQCSVSLTCFPFVTPLSGRSSRLRYSARAMRVRPGWGWGCSTNFSHAPEPRLRRRRGATVTSIGWMRRAPES